eukprot:COSAG04_NODE_22247_length_358_cov_0.826255_1_plen_96_part_10
MLVPFNLHVSYAGWSALQGHIEFRDFLALKMLETGLESVPLAMFMSISLALGDAVSQGVQCNAATDIQTCPVWNGVRVCCGINVTTYEDESANTPG